MTKKTTIKLDESLIISRLEQKELLDIPKHVDIDVRFFPRVTKTELVPFFNKVPCNLSLKLKLIGTDPLSVMINRGIFTHGLPQLLPELSPAKAVIAVGRLKLSSPIFYQIPLLLAFEALANIEEDDQRNLHYAIAIEFGRIAHHLTVIKNVLFCLELMSLADLVQDLFANLEKPILILDRVHLQSQCKISARPFIEVHDAIFDGLILAEEITSAIIHEDKIVKALAKKATISSSMATSMGLTGPYLRANRVPYDLRTTSSLKSIYGTPPTPSLCEGGDAFGRLVLRLLEITESLKWLTQALYRFEKNTTELGPITLSEDYCQKPPKTRLAFGEMEGPEGDVKMSIFTSADTEAPYTFAIRSPAYFVAQSIPTMLRATPVEELPLMLYSLGITAEEVDQ